MKMGNGKCGTGREIGGRIWKESEGGNVMMWCRDVKHWMRQQLGGWREGFG